MSIVNLHSFRTKYFADSVEWCLHPEHDQIFACGTYQLDDSTSGLVRRKGSILIFSFTFNGTDSDLQLLHEKETDGILDQKWLKNSEIPLLAAATSSGNIELFSWKDSQLESISSHRIDAEAQDNIALSLDWNSEKKQILVSDSKGYISLLDLANSSSIGLLNRWKAHSFEAWTCSFNKNNSDIVLTGGDDSFCRIYDLRDTTKEQMTIKSHEAGVTSFLTFEKHPNIFCTGSYDDHLRVFDMRSPRNPLNRINLSGGIWRLKSNPYEEELVLCACMYQNFTICRLCVEEPSAEFKIEATFNGDHKSICYGTDWSLQKSPNGQFIFGCCSFYDNLLTVNSIPHVI